MNLRQLSIAAVTFAVIMAPCVAAAQTPTAQPPATQSPKPPAVPASVEVDVVASSRSDLTVFVTQMWEGEDAKRMRQSLDVYFGAADGTLTPSEIDRIARAAETDMRESPVTWIRLGGEPFAVANVTVSFGNATGAVKDFRALTMIHDMTLTTTAPPAGEPAELRFDAQWNGTLSFRPPMDAHVANVSGLANAVSDANVTRGSFAAGQGIILTLAPGSAPAPVTETNTSAPPEDTTGNPSDTPPIESVGDQGSGVSVAMLGGASGVAFLVAGIALLTGIAFLVVVVRRRRKER